MEPRSNSRRLSAKHLKYVYLTSGGKPHPGYCVDLDTVVYDTRRFDGSRISLLGHILMLQDPLVKSHAYGMAGRPNWLRTYLQTAMTRSELYDYILEHIQQCKGICPRMLWESFSKSPLHSTLDISVAIVDRIIYAIIATENNAALC